MKKFNNDFLLGTSTAAHQVEGNNVNSDCWALEQIPHTNYADKSLDACDHYNRYKEDILLMKNAGYNAYRFSIEWARIEPKENEFLESEVEHYRDVIKCCKENGLEPMIVLHHFSSPAWLITKGGWETETVVADFVKYCQFVIERLGNEVTYVCTINEANIRLQIADIVKRYMMQAAAAQKQMESMAKDAENAVQMGINMKAMMEQQQLSAIEGAQAFGLQDPRNVHVFQSPCTENGDLIICKAHVAAKEAIKAINPNLKVGLSLSLHDFQPQPGCEEIAEKEWEKEFLHYLPYIQNDDYLGVQNYTRSLIGLDGLLPVPQGSETTQAGYEFYPEGLENVIRKVAKDLKAPIYITENGIATDDDTRRVAFIHTVVNGVQKCMEDGIDIRGYFHWTLMDNFEWQKGYSMRFGLISVDRTTQERTPKESFNVLASYR